MKFIIFILFFSYAYSFVNINNKKLNFNFKSTKLNSLYEYNKFDLDKSTYTIIGSNNNNVRELIKIVRYYKINYFYINIKYFTRDHIIKICKKYSINYNLDFYDKPHIFLKDKYIGNSFEFYEIIIGQ